IGARERVPQIRGEQLAPRDELVGELRRHLRMAPACRPAGRLDTRHQQRRDGRLVASIVTAVGAIVVAARREFALRAGEAPLSLRQGQCRCVYHGAVVAGQQRLSKYTWTRVIPAARDYGVAVELRDGRWELRK